MNETKLKYAGKKGTITMSNPQLSREYVFGTDPLWIPEGDAAWMMEVNPRMFVFMGHRLVDDPEIKAESKPLVETDQVEIEPVVEEKKKFYCPNCSRSFKQEAWLEKHMKKCVVEEAEED